MWGLQGVTHLICVSCYVRGRNVEMSGVYLVFGYIRSNTAVFQSTEFDT